MRLPMHLPSVAARYDQALKWAREKGLPSDAPRPLPASAWPQENVALLERYDAWLVGGGFSQAVTDVIYMSMAGHVLGLARKPHQELDLAVDFDRAMDYILAKRLSSQWTDNCRKALAKFRFFLRQERGLVEVEFRSVNLPYYCQGLPDWLTTHLERYQHLQQRNWHPSRIDRQATGFWSGHSRIWRWLFGRYPMAELSDLKRRYVLDYVDHRLAEGRSTSTVNSELRYFRAFLLFLQDQDFAVPQALLRVPSLKQADSLPRFLTDEQVRLLHGDLEARFAQVQPRYKRRDAALDRAAFYLMWQAGLRLGEVEELHLEDLDLSGRKITVRHGKGAKDRTVYLTDKTVLAIRDYLGLRGDGTSDHLFLYRNRPVHKDLLSCRIKASGERVGVHAHPHRLRHTCATQLLNAGCRVTSLQKLLGHRRLNSTMIYARVHDSTVAEDYYSAMARVEGMTLAAETKGTHEKTLGEAERAGLLELAKRVAEPDLSLEARLELANRMRLMLEKPSAA